MVQYTVHLLSKVTLRPRFVDVLVDFLYGHVTEQEVPRIVKFHLHYPDVGVVIGASSASAKNMMAVILFSTVPSLVRHLLFSFLTESLVKELSRYYYPCVTLCDERRKSNLHTSGMSCKGEPMRQPPQRSSNLVITRTQLQTPMFCVLFDPSELSLISF